MKINLPRLRRIGAFAIIAAMLLALFPYGRIPVMAAQSAPQQDATEFESGLAPEEYDLVYPKLSQFRAEASAESSKYDARDDGFVSPVRNQGTNSLCWAFATYGLAEANMLKNGLGTQDLSEMHLAYSTSNHSGNTAQGFDRAPGDGGNRFFASTYLMRGTNLSGAVNESVDPYSIFGLPDRALATTQGKAKSFTVRNILFLSDVKGSITNSTIKEEIVNNGAVAASMYWDGTATSDAGSGSTLYYNAPNAAYLYDGEPADTNHAVLIVGWDDAYPIANFNEGHRPTSNGAWLIKNSWGDGWGLDGYFWISYQDASFPLQTYTLDGVELYDASLKIYEHDYKWNGATAGGFTIGNTYARVFTVGSANETLKSVKLAFAQPVQNIEIDVITNFSPTGSYTMNPDMKVSTAFPGWHTFDFDIPIPLGAAGSKFAIVIKYAGYGWMGYDVSNAAADGTAYRWNVNSGAWEAQTLGYAIKGVATAMTDEVAVAAAKSSLTWNLIKGENPSQTSIRTNLVLPSSVGYGTSISWSSSNSAITSSGVVNRKDVNSQGNFIATITKGAASAQATFDLTVIGVPTADVDAVNSAASKITWDSVKNANTLINAVTTSLSALPSNISGVAATWVSSNPSYLANNGAVTRPRFDKGDQDAILTATLTKGEATKTASLNLKILAKEQTDDDSAQAVRDNLTFSTYWSIVRGENAAIEEVRYDLTVPTKGDYDTEAYGRARLSDGSVWSAITDEGKVIRPAYGQANTSGYFYLYFRKGSSMSYSRGWILTVLSYKGTVKINAQPADQTLAVGETKNLSVAGGANQGTPGSMRYQWYSNTAKSATGGTKIDGATSETYALPAGLAQGKYYYYCEVSALEAPPILSQVATVDVLAQSAETSAITAAKAAIEAASYTVLQSEASTQEILKTKLATVINALAGVSSNGITVAKENITISAFTAATAGTVSKLEGTNGSFTFAVKVEKGAGTPATASKSGVITAAAYDPAPDNTAIAEAKAKIEGTDYSVPQADAKTAADLSSWIAAKINGLSGMNGTGITVKITDITISNLIFATEGTVSSISGSNGSFSFTVLLAKGAGTPVTTHSISGAITAVAYDTGPDNDAIKAAKGFIQTGAYSVAQGTANDEASIKNWLAATINAMPNVAATGVVIAASDILATVYPATAGSVSDLDGTSGSFTFTVLVKKGAGTAVSTDPVGGVILASAYDTAPDNSAIASAVSLIQNGNYTVSQATANTEAAIKTWLAGQINALAGFAATGITMTAADITVSVTSAIAGTASAVNGTNGVFTFTAKVKKGAGTPVDTLSKNGEITATPYDASSDNTSISTAKGLIEGGSYTVPQAIANAEADVKTWLAGQINALTGFATTGITVTAADITASVTSAIAGTASAMDGINGSFTFTANVKKGAGTPVTTASKNGVITATPYDAGSDNSSISTAKGLIEGGNYTVHQAAANDEIAVKTWLAAQINALPSFAATGITVTEVDITATVTSAVTGTVSNVNGSNGSFDFTVNVKKGAGTPVTTTSVHGVITATAYNATSDNNAIASAANLIQGGSYTVLQATANTESAIKTWLAGQINALSGFAATGVTIAAADITVSVTSAIAGTASAMSGANGSFTFTANVKKGAGTPVTTLSKNGTITATPYDAGSDNTAIAAAKSLIEGGTYTVAQAEANGEASIKAWLVSEINALPGFDATGITITSADITATVTSAIAGTVSLVSGTNGLFSFTVNVKRGAGTPVDASSSGAITATPYDTGPDNAAIASAVNLIKNGTYSVVQVTANDEATVKAWLVGTINNLPGFAGTGVVIIGADILVTVNSATAGSVANVSGTSGSFTFTARVKRGAGTTVTTTSIGGVILATPYDTGPDNSAIATAKGLIEAGSYTVAQAAANTEAAIKTWLASQINALAGFAATGINVKAEDITITAFTSALAGTVSLVSGTNGSFSFTVNVKRGAGTHVDTAPKNGLITATLYDPTGDNNAIAAAKGLIEGGTYTVAQAAANDVTTIKAWLAGQINALPGFAATGIVIAPADISATATPAIAGTASAVSGTNGSFSFTVNVKKGAGTPVDTASKTGVITATIYDPTGDNSAIATAKSLIEGKTFAVAQAAANDEPAVKAWLVGQINALTGFAATGINVKAEDITISAFTSASAGTVSAVAGTDGSFAFTVNVKKGAGTPVNTTAKNGAIIATAYDASADDSAIAEAVALIEGGSYTVAQATAEENSVENWLMAQINAMPGFSATGIAIALGDISILVNNAIAGTASDTAGSNGFFSFAVTVKKGAGTPVDASSSGTITATPYDAGPDNAAIATAVGLIEGVTYTVAQAEANGEASIKALLVSEINSLPGFDTTGITITSADITATVTSAIAGTVSLVSGTDGLFSFTVNVKRGAGTPVDASSSGAITATPYDTGPDNAAIASAVNLIKSGTYSVAQTTANDEASVKAWLVGQINALPGFAGTGVVIANADILVTVNSATAGSVANISGTSGSFTFTAIVKRGAGTPVTTSPIGGVILATPYDTGPDNTAISTAVKLIEARAYTVTQAEANTEAAIKTWLVSKINALAGLDSTGITIMPSDISVTETIPAVAGTANSVLGKNGSFIFYAYVRKGAGTTLATATMVCEIVATPYDPTGDNNAIATAKGLIEGGTYTVAQAAANDVATIMAWLAGQINALPGFASTGITIDSTDITASVTAAIAGTVDAIAGANGSFDFTVNVKKGAGAPVDTASQNGIITATAYETSGDNADIAAAKSLIESGAYSVEQAVANDDSSVKSWLVSEINGLPGFDATGIVISEADIAIIDIAPAIAGTVDIIGGTGGSFSFAVNVKKGAGTPADTTPKSGVITATAYDSSGDNADISAAKALIEGESFSVDQAEANDEAAVKAWLEVTLNALPGLGITIAEADIAVAALAPATAGTQAISGGANGSFLFTAILRKGAGTPESVSKSGTIIATAYAGNAIGAAITTPATLNSKSYDTITINPALADVNPGNQAIEYSLTATGGWQTALAFTGLNPGTAYVVWARAQAVAGYDAGTPASSSEMLTDAAPTIAYTVTFDPNGGSVAPSSSVTSVDGKLSSLPTPSRPGYSFEGWYTQASGGSRVEPSRMYAANTTIFAHWISNGNGSGNFSGYTPPSPPAPTPTPTPKPTASPDPAKLLPVADGKATVPYTESDGDIELTFPDSVVDDIIVDAQAPGRGGMAVLDATVVQGSSSLTLPGDDLGKLANVGVEVRLQSGSVTLDRMVISSVVSNSKDAKVKISIKEAKDLTPNQAKAIGNRPAFDVSIIRGGVALKQFIGGNLTVCLPYTLKPGEDASRLSAYYVGTDGKRERVESSYDSYNKIVLFSTRHLSTFYIAYDEWINTYPDVAESAWYYNAVKYVSKGGLFSGTDKGFEPEVSMTRAMLVTVLYNYQKPGKGLSNSAFSDVPAGQWYSDPIAWAAANGIVSGYDGKFRPNDLVTRQEAFVVMRQFAKLIGKESDKLESNDLTFADAEKVSVWAHEAAVWATKTGIVSGKPGNLLDPLGTATRAEMATMLMNFIENVI